MFDFFENIYGFLFEKMIGLNVFDFMSDSDNNYFSTLGLIMTVLSLITFVLYYYVINKVSLAKWWGWGIYLLCNAAVNFVIGYFWHSKQYIAEGGVGSDLIGLAFANAILSMIFFFVFSMLGKWWSSNSNHSPF